MSHVVVHVACRTGRVWFWVLHVGFGFEQVVLLVRSQTGHPQACLAFQGDFELEDNRTVIIS